jgi:hypothetical protein
MGLACGGPAMNFENFSPEALAPRLNDELYHFSLDKDATINKRFAMALLTYSLA